MPPEIFITRADSLNTNPVNVQLASAAELIKTGRFEELFDKFLTGSIDFIGKLLIALLIFYVGKWIIRRITKFSYSVFEKNLRYRAAQFPFKHSQHPPLHHSCHYDNKYCRHKNCLHSGTYWIGRTGGRVSGERQSCQLCRRG